jgi:carbonic anhydrase
MARTRRVDAYWDLPAAWRGTPIEDLLAYQNQGKPHRTHDATDLLIAACMDPRVVLRIPAGFAYVLRTAAGHLAPVDFNVSYVVGARGVRHVAVVGHTQCRAVAFGGRQDELVDGLVTNAGWTRERARRHVAERAAAFAIDDPASFALREARRVEVEYPRVRAAALLYDVADHRLALLED